MVIIVAIFSWTGGCSSKQQAALFLGGPFHLTKHSISEEFWVTTKHARRGEMVGNFTSQRMVGHFTSQSIQLARVCWGDNLICKEGEMVGQFTSPSK
jgi:hypothetical protein